MNVLIINKSDCVGGAAMVSHRLMKALRAEGVDARMLVMNIDGEHDDNISEITNKKTAKFHFIAERGEIFVSNGFSRENLFKVSTALNGLDLSKHPMVLEADVIMLNWINQGMLSLKGIEHLASLGKPIIWTMHDMWCATGICHHAYDCEGYKKECGECRYLSSTNPHDLSHKVLLKKRELYSCADIQFVAVSSWLAAKCHESELMKHLRLRIIPNAFPDDMFHYERCDNIPLNIPKDKTVIVMGAARLDDPVKGFDYLIELTEYINNEMPRLSENLHLLLFGNIRNSELLQRLKIPHTFIGNVKGTDAINNVYRNADIVLSTSLYETLPGTLIEGMASGCIPVSFGNGGQSDIVDHKKNGYIAQNLSVKDMAHGIEWSVASAIDRKYLHDEVVRKFSASVVARKYIELCNDLIRTKK